jgi:hypothetical protein
MKKSAWFFFGAISGGVILAAQDMFKASGTLTQVAVGILIYWTAELAVSLLDNMFVSKEKSDDEVL